MTAARTALLIALAIGGGFAIWANLPEHDPWTDVPPGQPHPRMGARVTIAPGTYVHLPPMELQPRRMDPPVHWRSELATLSDTQITSALPPPDQQETGPDGRTHRFWNSWCPAGANSPWVAHVWVESRQSRVLAVHVVGGGGVLVDESTPTAAVAPSNAGVPDRDR